MNWLSVILLVLFVLTLLILVLIAGYSSGKQEGKKEAATSTYKVDVETPEIDKDVLRKAIMDSAHEITTSQDWLRNHTGPKGDPGETPNANDLIVDPILDLTLAEWKRAVESRLTRVEKKSGLSV